MNHKKINKIKESIISLLWPEVCPFCQKVCRDGICKECRKKLELLKVREPRCMQCGKQIRSVEQEYQSVYQFKYHNQRRYGILYSQELVKEFQKEIERWRPDIIMPVPLHPSRKRKRGYNQAQILAEEIGKILEIPVDSKSLIRTRKTSPQKKLGHQERKKNLKHAFAVKHTFQAVKRVLLVDDIYTTGNTIDAVSNVLKQKGVENVYFLTISIGQGY